VARVEDPVVSDWTLRGFHGGVVGMSFPRTPEESLQAVLDALAENPHDPYWSLRLLGLHVRPTDPPTLQDQLVDALADWASYDPAAIAHSSLIGGAMWINPWPDDALEAVERRVNVEDESLRHLVLGMVWWEAVPRYVSPEGNVDYEASERARLGRALGHLALVERQHATRRFHDAFREALRHADPAMILRSSEALLSGRASLEGVDVRRALLEASFRAGNWDAFELHRVAYAAKQASGETSTHDDRAVLQLDGLHALHHGLDAAVARVVKKLIEVDRGSTFLGGLDALPLLKGLVDRGKHLDLCRAYVRALRKARPKLPQMARELEERIRAAKVPKRRGRGGRAKK
jgi:hypothetical protein